MDQVYAPLEAIRPVGRSTIQRRDQSRLCVIHSRCQALLFSDSQSEFVLVLLHNRTSNIETARSQMPFQQLERSHCLIFSIPKVGTFARTQTPFQHLECAHCLDSFMPIFGMLTEKHYSNNWHTHATRARPFQDLERSRRHAIPTTGKLTCKEGFSSLLRYWYRGRHRY